MLEYLGGYWSTWREMLEYLGRCWSIWDGVAGASGGCSSIWGTCSAPHRFTPAPEPDSLTSGAVGRRVGMGHACACVCMHVRACVCSSCMCTCKACAGRDTGPHGHCSQGCGFRSGGNAFPASGRHGESGRRGWTDGRTGENGHGHAASSPDHAQRLLRVCNFTTVPKRGTEVN